MFAQMLNQGLIALRLVFADNPKSYVNANFKKEKALSEKMGLFWFRPHPTNPLSQGEGEKCVYVSADLESA